jgi:hypothetical protein
VRRACMRSETYPAESRQRIRGALFRLLAGDTQVTHVPHSAVAEVRRATYYVLPTAVRPQQRIKLSGGVPVIEVAGGSRDQESLVAGPLTSWKEAA